jgi:uncharacterized protein YlxW (UPF0749 family)
MSTPVDLNGIQRVCDDQGRSVAVVLANQAFENLTAEADRLRDEAARLQAQVKELQQTLDAVTAERDMQLKSLYALTREDWTITAEEIAELDKNGVEFTREFIDELERDLGSSERRDG